MSRRSEWKFTTASVSVVPMMLVAVQKDNLGLSVNLIGLFRVYSSGGFNELDKEMIVWKCLFPFPYLSWASIHSTFIVVHVRNGQCCPSW